MRQIVALPNRLFQSFLARRKCYVAVLAASVVLAIEPIAANRAVAVTEPDRQTIELAQASPTPAADALLEEGSRLFQEGSADSLRQAIQTWQQARVLYQQAGNQGSEAFCLLGIGRVYNALGDKQLALDYFNQALPLSRAVGDPVGENLILHNIGRVYYDMEHKQRALDYFNQALPLSRAVGDRAGEALILYDIGRVYYHMEDKQRALDYYNQALPLSRAVGDRAVEAVALHDIGRVYSALGEQQQALDYFNQALPLFRAVGDRKNEATTLGYIGNVYSALGEQQQALDYYNNQALPLFRAVGDRAGEAATLNSIGLVYSGLGDKQLALDYYNQALHLSRAEGDRAGEATTLNNIGLVYSGLGDKQLALDYHNQALHLSRAEGDRAGEAATLNNIGHVYFDLGDKQLALDYYNQALPLFRAEGNRAGEATTLVGIGNFYSALGDKEQALDYYNQALHLSRAVSNRVGEATTLNNIGFVYSALGDKEQALDYFNQARPLFRAVGDREGEATTLGNLALLYRQQGDLTAALKHIDAAIALIEYMRASFTNQDLQTAYFSTVQSYYQFKIDLLMPMGEEEAAFNTSEAARARGLLELLNESQVDIRQGVAPNLLAEEQALRQTLQTLEARRIALQSGDHTPEAAAVLDQESDDVLRQLEQNLAEIRQVSPAYVDLVKPQPLTLPEIQRQVLDQDTVLLQYALGDEQSYLWVVGSGAGQFQSYTLPGQAEITTAANRFLSSVSIPGSFAFSDVKRTGEALRDVVLPELPTWAVGKRLLVMGDGRLYEVPFAALPVLGQEDYAPLLTEHEILSPSSASSIAILRQSLGNRAAAPKTLAVLADPVYRSDDERVAGRGQPVPVSNTLVSQERVASQNHSTPISNTLISYDPNAATLTRTLRDLDLRNIARLPYTRAEAEAILPLVPAEQRTAVFDFAANHDWITSADLSQYRLVHMATHGFVNPDNPALSGVVLALVDEQGNTRSNGFLRLHDIFNLRLNADLVVLSACETGLGSQVGGEGLVGLSRGFMYAGAERLAVSLWAISDSGTAQVMSQFYGHMLAGEQMTPAEALRETQRTMWEAGESPYYWAAFTLQGEWR